MKIFHLHEPPPAGFARAVRVGTWEDDRACWKCQRSLARRVPPLVLEWQPSSTEIADCTWPGLGGDLVVSERARQVIQPLIKNGRFLAVEMQEDRAFAKLSAGRRKTLVSLPYEGPPLYDFWADDVVPIDLERSGYRFKETCSACGRTYYDKPPVDEMRLFIDSANWDGSHVFKLREGSGWYFVTEEARRAMEAAALTNLGFRDAGQIA